MKTRANLAYLKSANLITKTEILPALEWCFYHHVAQIQPMHSLSWDVPIWAQRIYQTRGELSEMQDEALDYRKNAFRSLGCVDFDALDQIICEDSAQFSEVDMVSALLKLSYYSGMQTTIEDDGMAWENDDDLVEHYIAEKAKYRLRHEQPHLFLPHRKRY